MAGDDDEGDDEGVGSCEAAGQFWASYLYSSSSNVTTVMERRIVYTAAAVTRLLYVHISAEMMSDEFVCTLGMVLCECFS